MPNYSAGTASVEISPDFRGFVRELRAELDSVTAELDVNIHPDTSNFGTQLNTELSRVTAEFDVTILPDITGFSAELATELSRINADFHVDIHPDISGFAGELGTELGRVNADLDVQIHPDTSGFATELGTELGRLNSEHDVRIVPDVTGFETDLQTKLAGVAAEVKVKVEPDTASLAALQGKIQDKLDRMRLGVTVRVDANTRTAAAEIDALRRLVRNMQVNVGANTSSARREIDSLSRRDVTVTVNARRGSGLGGSNGSDGDRSLGGLIDTKLLLGGALAVAQLPAVATAVASLGPDIESLLQTSLLLPAAFSGAALGIGTLVVGMQGMKDAFSDNAKKSAAAMQNMAENAKETVRTIKSFDDQRKDLVKSTQSNLFEGVSGPLHDTIAAQLPVLKAGMGGLATELGNGFKIALGELGNGQSTSALSTLFGNTTIAASKLNGAIAPIISSIRTLVTTGSSFLPQLAGGFTDLATRLSTFLTQAQKSGDLSRWMQEGIRAVSTLGSILANLGSSIASVFRAAKGDGDGFLTTVDNLTAKMSTWLKSTTGQTELRTFFAQGREQLEKWGPALSAIGTILGSIYQGAQAWSGIMLPFLQAAAGLLSQHQGLVTTIVTAYLAFKTVTLVMGLVQGAITGVTTAMAAYNAAMTRGATAAFAASLSGAGGLGAALTGVTAALAPLGIGAIAIGAAAGLTLLANKHADAKAAADAQRAALEQLASTLDKQTGKVTEQTISTATEQLEKTGYLERAQTLGVDPHAYVRAGLGLDGTSKAQINDRLTQVILEQYPKDKNSEMQFNQTTETLGLSKTDVAQALQGIPEAIAKFNAAWAKNGNGSIQDLSELKAVLNDVGESAATLGGEMNGLDSNTNKAGQSAIRMQEALNGTFDLTAQGKQAFDDLGLAVQRVPDAKTILVNSTTDEQQRKLEELGFTVEHMKDGTVKITLSDEAARAQIAQITAPATKTVTVELNNVVAPNSLNTGTVQKLHENIDAIPKAEGGEITGGIAGRDSVPLLGMPGEHMLTTSDVDKLGGQAGVYRFRSALQAGLVRGYKTGGAVGWTDEDETKLQSAITAVEQAKEAAEKKRNSPKASQADKDQAELAITKAQQKADKLQAQKDGTAPSGTTYPQAQLPSAKTDTQISIENAKASVDEANTKRNKIYADPASTDAEKLAADNAYLSAQNSLTSAQKKSSTSSDSTGIENYSLQGIFSRAGTILADGLLSAFGLENSILSSNNVYNKALNSVVNHYTNSDGTTTDTTNDYSYTPQNLTTKDDTTSTTTGTSTDTADSGTSYSTQGGAEQWRPTFASVLKTLEMPAGWITKGLQQLMFESGGNPRAQNNSDSNAAKGTPSKGLMQVIDPTFASYRSSLYANDIWNPSANIAAALKYTVARYGSPENIWGQGRGYRDGGWVTGPGGPQSDSVGIRASRDEFVVNATSAQANAPWLEAINSGATLAAPAALPAGLGATTTRNSSVTHDRSVQFNAPIQLMNVDHLMREQDRWQSMQAQGAMAALP